MEDKLKKLGMAETPFYTGEKWVDENGRVFNVEYAPIDWLRNFGKVQKTVEDIIK